MLLVEQSRASTLENLYTCDHVLLLNLNSHFIFGVKILKDLISQKPLKPDQKEGLVYPQNCEARIRSTMQQDIIGLSDEKETKNSVKTDKED